MSLGRCWPVYVAGLLAVIAGIAGGAGAALGAFLLGVVLIGGPAYLFQQHLRRRRGARPSNVVLGRDLDAALTSALATELRFIQRHPVGAYALTVALSAGVFMLLWRTMSLTAAIVLVSIPIAIGLAASIMAARRRS
jgi:hypothetical protein